MWSLKRNDEAIAQYKKQIEIVPLDKWAHGQLGSLYAELKRWDEAAASLERAVGITPENGAAWAALGRVQVERNQTDEGLKAFARAVELSATPYVWNTAAWALADKGVKLDVAEQYVRKAIDGIATSLQNVTLDPLVPAQVVATMSQAAYWDTLGWIYFKNGDFVQAERWIRAAWMLAQDPQVGEHLAMTYEAQGNRARAIELYAQAVGIGSAGSAVRAVSTGSVGSAGSTGSVSHDSSRKALARLLGGDAIEVENRLAAGRTMLVDQRTIKLSRLVPSAARGDVSLLMGADGRVTRVKFIKGDESLRAPIAALKGLKAPALQPDDRTMTFIRHGIVGCSTSSGCVLVLMRPADMPPPAAAPPAAP